MSNPTFISKESVKPRTSSRFTPRRLLITALEMIAAFLWYASPDFLRNTSKLRWFRLVILPAMGILAGVVFIDTVKQVRTDITSASPDQEAWEMDSNNITWSRENLNWKGIGLLGTLIGLLATLSVWSEKALFKRGERRHREGVKLPHTRQGAVLAVLTAIAYFLDDAQAD